MKFQYDPSFAVNDDLARDLLKITEDSLAQTAAGYDEEAAEPAPGEVELPLRGADAIVAHIEINNRHGVGVLLERLFGRYRNVLSVRSENHFGGRQDFGDLDLCVSHESSSRDGWAASVREALGDNTVARVLCVPYYPDDVRNALALTSIFDCPLATYLMDDQNVCSDGISDELMSELLERSSLRLAISAELATCYEAKYGHRMWLMPPVVPARLIPPAPLASEECLAQPKTGAILGNIWGQRWLDLLRETVRESGVKLRWYSTNHLRYLSGSPESLAKDGIEIPLGPPLPDAELVELLRRTAFVVVPTGTLDEEDDRKFIAQLSLPSRIPFILATSQTPFLVLGSEQTGAARFVREMETGVVAPYERRAFREAVARITEPECNTKLRRRALALSGRFADAGAAEWIWQSLDLGQPFDGRHEEWMRKPRPDIESLAKGRQAGRGLDGK